MLEQLKEEVYHQNYALFEKGLILFTWGNVSGIDRTNNLIVIKPSGVPYEQMKPEDMVVVDLEGQVIEGTYRPSTDLPTHIELYKGLPHIGGVAHTHSTYATSFAQACSPISCLGTTQADYFPMDVPCTRFLSEKEINDGYEKNTGKLIIETLKEAGSEKLNGILCSGHGPFTWGISPKEAVFHAAVLEELAKLNFLTFSLGHIKRLPGHILEKHYERKHGKSAYYGQP